MSSVERPDLVRSAVAFLSDPKTQASSYAQRVQFLEAKGLTPSEIEEAMRQATRLQTSNYNSPYMSSLPPTYEPSMYSARTNDAQAWDWRDYFIMAVVSGSFTYGAISLARRYLLPYLKPPSSTAYEADRDALTAQFDAAEALLQEIQAETSAVRKAVDEQKEKVDKVTQDVETAVTEMREGDQRNRDEIREIRDEVNAIREMLPKMMDKNKESQSQSLAELQQELKSLKALLLSRGPGFPSSPSPIPGFTSRPSIPSWQLANVNGSQTDVNSPTSQTSIVTPIAAPAEGTT
ncbi:hypothetical protein BD410DRAFT_760268 [Rickenella mellea]|uniref:Peroxisomal membrane protein PEX14 n=1 Tax=Rickenella mellea TaxID=50990 RepID=A0A4Y7QMV1_9AGAM|nr:hypothetical protein BD410DRAFT_760268 [Rickenella mellea]